MWLHAENIACVHGFSNRHGGVSPAPYHSLNLGGSEDSQINITQNRSVALQQLGANAGQLCFLKQVHGTTVCDARLGQQEGDALVTRHKDLALAISIADCYPLLFHDPVNGIIGAAHAGWRGTAGSIAAHAITRMKALGASTNSIKVAIGQGISREKFEVGDEVIAQFIHNGFPENCWNKNKIDLVKCNIFTLQKNGILPENIWTMNRCTFESDFFSYRRDKGVTGRMWAVIMLK